MKGDMPKHDHRGEEVIEGKRVTGQSVGVGSEARKPWVL